MATLSLLCRSRSPVFYARARAYFKLKLEMSWVFHTKKRPKSPSHPLALAPCARDTCVHIYKYKAMEMSRLPTPPLSPSSTRLFDPLDPLHPNRVIAHFDLIVFIVRSNANSMGRCETDRPACASDPFEKDGVRTREPQRIGKRIYRDRVRITV